MNTCDSGGMSVSPVGAFSRVTETRPYVRFWMLLLNASEMDPIVACGGRDTEMTMSSEERTVVLLVALYVAL